MQIDTSTVTQSPKTTLIGLCGLLIAGMQCVHFDAAGALMMSCKDWFGVAIGVLFALVGALSHDAQKQA
jgi:hypothetical protein